MGVVNNPLLIISSVPQPDGSVLVRDPSLSYSIVEYSIPLYDRSGQTVPTGAEAFVVIGADQILQPGIRVGAAGVDAVKIGMLLRCVWYTSKPELGSIIILNDLVVPPEPRILLADASIVIGRVKYVKLFMSVNAIELEKFKLPFVNILPLLISLVLTLAKVVSLLFPEALPLTASTGYV